MTKLAALLSASFLVACGAESSDSGDLQTHINATTVSGVYTEAGVAIDFASVPVGNDAFEVTIATDRFVYVGTFDRAGVELEYDLYIDDDEPLPAGAAWQEHGNYGVKIPEPRSPGTSQLDDDGPPIRPADSDRVRLGNFGVAIGDVLNGGINDPTPPSGGIVLPALDSLFAHLAARDLNR